MKDVIFRFLMDFYQRWECTLNRIWHNSFYPLLIVALLIPTAHASLDLLAGVEAGIETDTAMTTIDLDRTQEILSSNDFESEHGWINHHTGIQYQIQLLRSYSYGLLAWVFYGASAINTARFGAGYPSMVLCIS